MKFLFDLLPVILFFAAYKIWDIFIATAVAIGTALLQVIILYIKDKQVPKTYQVTLIILIIFGGLTLVLKNPVFIKWKPTIVNWLFAFAFLLAPLSLFGGKNIPYRMMSGNVEMPMKRWSQLNSLWVGFFFFLGVLNLWVAYSFSEEIWVNFKLFGLMGLTLLFVLVQGLFIFKYLNKT